MATYDFEGKEEYQEFAKIFFAENGREPNDLDKVVFSSQLAAQQRMHPTAFGARLFVFVCGFGSGFAFCYLLFGGG